MTEEELKQILGDVLKEIRSRWGMEVTLEYREAKTWRGRQWSVNIVKDGSYFVHLDVMTDKIDIRIPNHRKRYVKRTSKGTFVINTISRNVVLFLREEERIKEEQELRKKRIRSSNNRQTLLRKQVYSEMGVTVRPTYDGGKRIILEFLSTGDEILDSKLIQKIDSLITFYQAETRYQDIDLWKLLNEEADPKESSQEADPTS